MSFIQHCGVNFSVRCLCVCMFCIILLASKTVTNVDAAVPCYAITLENVLYMYVHAQVFKQKKRKKNVHANTLRAYAIDDDLSMRRRAFCVNC